ncbi:MAG: zinc-dependent alcohol dehydrogenase family protein, partial [Lachnospiraceae bacterium]|nr:zinc-dependent alcohol dehydrogenase family protein [Lachnospiraceae bacterium]
MKAVVLYGPHNVAVGELPEPPLGAGDVRIRVAYCGICGSDLHKFEGKANTHPIRYPVALGHEISGVVAAVGENVTNFRPGDRVTADPNWSCGKCRYCRAGKPSFCERARGVVKGMAEYVSVPEENVYALPDNLSLRDAALAEPLACCLHGIDLLDVRQGERVVLVGLGAIGLIMMQLLRRTGAASITVVEYAAEKRELALSLGATEFVCSKDEEALERYLKTPSGDKVIECVGRGAAQQIALSAADKGATVVLFGVSDAAEKLPVSFYDAFAKELTIKTSFVNPHTTARAVALLAS